MPLYHWNSIFVTNTGQGLIGSVEFSFLFFFWRGVGSIAYIKSDICSTKLFGMFLNKHLTDENIFSLYAFTITKE